MQGLTGNTNLELERVSTQETNASGVVSDNENKHENETETSNNGVLNKSCKTDKSNEPKKSIIETVDFARLKSTMEITDFQSNEIEELMNHIDSKFHKDDHYKTIFLFGIFMFIFLATNLLNLSFYTQLSLIIFIFYLQWIILTYYTLFTSKSICAIRVITTNIHGFGKLVTYPVKIIRLSDSPMESISEFAGARGGSLHVSMYTMALANSIQFSIALRVRRIEILDYHLYSNTSAVDDGDDLTVSQNIAFVSGYLAAVGILFIGFFELNKFSKLYSSFHYLGIVLMTQGIICFGIVCQFNIVWYIVAVIGVILAVAYFILAIKYGFGKVYPNEPEKVHKISVMLVSLEVAVISCAAFATFYTCFHLGDL